MHFDISFVHQLMTYLTTETKGADNQGSTELYYTDYYYCLKHEEVIWLYVHWSLYCERQLMSCTNCA